MGWVWEGALLCPLPWNDYLLPDGGVVDDGDDELLELEPAVGSVERDGAPGEADGVRSVPGRSPTRSLRDSLQPAIIVAPRATAKTALSNFFISVPPVDGGVRRSQRLQCQCHAPECPGTLGRLSSRT